ncbi:Hypothetical predicted protein, partial [Pelobates cultripes]
RSSRSQLGKSRAVWRLRGTEKLRPTLQDGICSRLFTNCPGLTDLLGREAYKSPTQLMGTILRYTELTNEQSPPP